MPDGKPDAELGYRARVRLGVALLLVAFLFAPAAAAVPASFWPVSKVMRAIDRAPLRVEGRRILVDSETTLCSGIGSSIRVRGQRRWRAFRCTYTTFSPRGVDRDVEFRVRILDAQRFRITDAEWVRESR
jgi:hypothetical protein